MKDNKLLIGVLVLFIGAILFLTSKTGNATPIKKINTQSVINANISSTLAIGDVAPNFSLTTLDGQTFKLNDKKGKTVILFGMAGWCGTCIPEGRALTQVRKVYADKGVDVIGIAFTKGDNEDFLKEFKQLGTIDIPLALDTDNVASKYQLVKLETTYIINRDGVIVYKDEGFTGFDDYRKELDQLL